jgi:hypothetical protein
MRRTLLTLASGLSGFALFGSVAMAQTEPMTPAQIQQQGDAAIRQSSDSLAQSMNQQQQGLIEQQQRQQALFAASRPRVPGTPPPAVPARRAPGQPKQP